MSSVTQHQTLGTVTNLGPHAQGLPHPGSNQPSMMVLQLDSASYPITANMAGTFRVYDPANPGVNDGVLVATQCYFDTNHNILYILRQTPGVDIAIADGAPADVSCSFVNNDGNTVSLYWKGTYSHSPWLGNRFYYSLPYPQVRIISAD
jgi:hypothetical protein